MRKLLLFAFALTCLSSANAQLITGFGSSEFNPATNDLGGLWSYTASTTTITGTGKDDDSPGIASSLASYVNISGNSLLSLSGTLNSTAPASASFSIYLYDAEYDSVYATYNWSSFLGGSTQISSLSTNASFNASHVSYWSLNVGGLGETVSFTFDGLSAVPEPTSMLLLGMGLCGLAMRRSLRRR